VIGREVARGNDTMHVRVNIELLAPSVQDTEETDLRTEMFRVTNDFEKGFCWSPVDGLRAGAYFLLDTPEAKEQYVPLY
jgi:hypothetical protein